MLYIYIYILLLFILYSYYYLYYIIIINIKERSKEKSIKRQQKANSYKKNFFALHIKMLNISLKELKKIAKMRRIKGYKSMSKEKLLSAFGESECNSIESAGSRSNFNNARIKKIEKILLN